MVLASLLLAAAAHAQEPPLLAKVQACYRDLPGFTMEGKAWILEPRTRGERTWTLHFARPNRILWVGRRDGDAEVRLVCDGRRAVLQRDGESRELPVPMDASGVAHLGLGLDSIWLGLALGAATPGNVASRGPVTVDGQALETLFVRRGWPPCDLYLYVEPATGLIRCVRVDDAEGRTAGFASLRYTSLEAPPAQVFEE